MAWLIEETIVYCPKCNRKVMTYNDDYMIPKYGKCKKCNKLVLKKPGELPVLKDKPMRTTASGCTFY